MVEPVRLVTLTNGKAVLIDEGDWSVVSGHRWHASRSTTGDYYAATKINGKIVTLHRFIVGVKGRCTDHRNRVTLDNRRCNLRPATGSQNGANSRKRPSLGGYRGVYPQKQVGRWLAIISIKGKLKYLGIFADPADAARAYDAAAIEHFGEFAMPNFPAVHAGRRRQGRASS